MFVDVYHWFDKSSKRKNTLKQFCEFMKQEYKKTIKHVSTCCMSLQSTVTLCLKLCPKGNQRFAKLLGKFSNPVTEVYLYFYQFFLQPFIRPSFYLQREDPLISKLYAQIHRFLKDFACKFVKIRDVKNCRNISHLKYKDPPCQKEGKRCVIFQCDFTIYFIKALILWL